MMKRKVIVLFLGTRIHFESKVSHISYDKLKITKVQALLLGKNFFLYQATVLFFSNTICNDTDNGYSFQHPLLSSTSLGAKRIVI